MLVAWTSSGDAGVRLVRGRQALTSSWVFTPGIRRTDPQPNRAHTTSSPAPNSEPRVSRTRSPLVSALPSDRDVPNQASERHS
jgi:hypothetical protein